MAGPMAAASSNAPNVHTLRAGLHASAVLAPGAHAHPSAMSAKPRVLPIPQQIVEIVDEELAGARGRILARVSELFGTPIPASTPPRARSLALALAPPASVKSKRYRASAEEVEELQNRVLGLFKAKGSEMKPRQVMRALGPEVDRHRVSHALRALAEAGKLKLLGERGGARYVRAR